MNQLVQQATHKMTEFELHAYILRILIWVLSFTVGSDLSIIVLADPRLYGES